MTMDYDRRTTQMDDLPVKLITLILKQLDIEQIRNCRLLSTKFNWIIENNIKVTNLVICEEFGKWINTNYFFTNRLVNSGYTISKPSELSFKTQFMQTILSRVKRLFVNCYLIEESTGLDIGSFLNQFQQLNQLELDDYNESLNGVFHLTLANLKVLCFNTVINPYNHYKSASKIEINCPQLIAFRLKGPLSLFQFLFPETVQDLSLAKFQNISQQFINLERLYINDGDSVDSNVLKLFYNLKELHCEEMRKTTITNLLHCKNVVRSSVKLYLYGIQVSNVSELEFYFPKDRKRNINNSDYLRNDAIIEHYETDKLAFHLPWFTHLHYLKLVDIYPTIPDDFLTRCMNIRKLTIWRTKRTIDQKQLMNFLKHCPVLISLHFETTLFERWFLDDLPIFCKYIVNLTLLDEHNKLVDESFLLKFKYLDDFFICQNLSIETITSALENMESLEKFHFGYDDYMFDYRYEDRAFTLRYDLDGKYESTCYFGNKSCVIHFLKCRSYMNKMETKNDTQTESDVETNSTESDVETNSTESDTNMIVKWTLKMMWKRIVRKLIRI